MLYFEDCPALLVGVWTRAAWLWTLWDAGGCCHFIFGFQGTGNRLPPSQIVQAGSTTPFQHNFMKIQSLQRNLSSEQIASELEYVLPCGSRLISAKAAYLAARPGSIRRKTTCRSILVSTPHCCHHNHHFQFFCKCDFCLSHSTDAKLREFRQPAF